VTADVNFSYSSVDISNLQNAINKAIAKKVNLKYFSDSFDLNYRFKDDLYLKLIEYNSILDKVVACNSCFKDYKIEDIISTIKTTLTKI